MGGDGGSIPSRIDLVRTSGYAFSRNLGGMGYLPNTQCRAGDEHLSSNQMKELRWKTCALSQEPLAPPIVSCKLGLLYNKEAVLKYILSKKPKPSFEHLKGLRDIKDVEFMVDKVTQRFLCPILRTELSASNRGVLIWKCGCCVSEKAFKQFMKNDSTEGLCPNCNSSFKYNPEVFNKSQTLPFSSDLVFLVPDLNEEGLLRTKLLHLNNKTIKTQ
ncbi:uncharacterized protein TA02855 [Theileria annulata]|uniref:Replication termination factor 2 n=1 Tax=Theileria annulata TaxID=5874 RepID=Q4UHK3_THEAN|nr:uncharacterized protein TA02855 [Theileria annulata]CAI73436.1 hypothetical protein, conserved [Theileria annulata]|eukprot:XP_954113.1 hypothetical protein, conserved [Theileria annulata]